MAKKAEIERFKLAFRKPVRPKGVSKSDRSGLDKAVKKLEGDKFEAAADALWKKQPDYFLDLLVYKLAKYWEDDKSQYWIEKTPPQALAVAMDRIMSDADEDDVAESVRDLSGTKTGITGVLARTGARGAAALVDHMSTLNAENLLAMAGKVPPDFYTDMLEQSVAKDSADVAALFATGAGTLDPADLRRIAATDPAFFMNHVLAPFKSDAQCVGLIKDRALQAVLQQDVNAWRDFVAATPVRSLSSKAVGGTPKAKTDALFTALCSNDGIELTYYTNTLDQDWPSYWAWAKQM